MTAPAHAPISAAEQTRAARIGAAFFRHRSWLPLLFLGILLIAPAAPSQADWIMGGIFIVIGEAFRLAGVAAAGTETRRRSRAVQRLVTYGVFAWSRNPLYNGNFLIWMGFVVLYGVLWFLPVAIVLFAVEYSFIVRYEEGVLESIFGSDYLKYKARTPRWIPRFSSSAAQPDGYHWADAWRSEISTFLQYAVLVAVLVIKSRFFVRDSGKPFPRSRQRTHVVISPSTARRSFSSTEPCRWVSQSACLQDGHTPPAPGVKGTPQRSQCHL